ncbi:MAG: nitrogen regulation protein NR(II) [Paracoccaceae bacterium]
MSGPGEAVWNALPVPALMLDGADAITGVNPAAELFLNSSAHKLLARPLKSRLSTDAPLDAALSRVRNNHAAVFVRNVDIAATGHAMVPCNLQIAPLAGPPPGVLLVIEPHRMSDRLARSHTITSSARSAIGMAEMLAHEIKNPLAGITGAAQLLAMNLEASDREMTDLIVAESRRIVALLEQVEQFGNLRPPQKSAVNIHGILDRARISASVGFGAGMDFAVAYDPSLPEAYVDRDQIMQVVLNLMKNAVQASQSKEKNRKGTLTIRTYFDHGPRLRRRDGSDQSLPLQVEIIDDGPGVAPDILDDIFEPFVSGHENGTGLGLALVSKIIAGHDAWINLQSVPGHTVFRLSLPVAPTGEAAGAAAPENAKES